MNNMMVLLTFGICSPILSFVIVLTICLHSFQWLYYIGRFYILRIENYDQVVIYQEKKRQTSKFEVCEISSINSLDSSYESADMNNHIINRGMISSNQNNNNRVKNFGGYNFQEDDQKVSFSSLFNPNGMDNNINININNSNLHLITANSKFDIYLRTINALLEETIGHYKICIWPILWTSCLFMLCLCWDMAGDNVGWKKALWVPGCSLLILPLIWCCNYLIRYYQCFKEKEDDNLLRNINDINFEININDQLIGEEKYNYNEYLYDEENKGLNNTTNNNNIIRNSNGRSSNQSSNMSVDKSNVKLNQEDNGQVVSTIHSERGQIL